jgi:hypothetical protein
MLVGHRYLRVIYSTGNRECLQVQTLDIVEGTSVRWYVGTAKQVTASRQGRKGFERVLLQSVDRVLPLLGLSHTYRGTIFQNICDKATDPLNAKERGGQSTSRHGRQPVRAGGCNASLKLRARDTGTWCSSTRNGYKINIDLPFPFVFLVCCLCPYWGRTA